MFNARPVPTEEWRSVMSALSDRSCAAYRQVVREEPRFVPYFRAATPEVELSALNVGSRPAKRCVLAVYMNYPQTRWP